MDRQVIFEVNRQGWNTDFISVNRDKWMPIISAKNGYCELKVVNLADPNNRWTSYAPFDSVTISFEMPEYQKKRAKYHD